MFHSLQFNFIENLMPWLRFLNLWLLTMGSHGEAKGKPRGSQGEAKGKPRGSQGEARGSQGEAKGKPNVTQKNSMEAKKPKVYGG